MKTKTEQQKRKQEEFEANANIAAKILTQPEIQKGLVDYYKWVVNLATFVLTLSLGLTPLVRTANDLKYEWLFITGWLLLGLCIFLNWLLIKRFIVMPIIEQTPEEQRGFIATIMRYSFVRNIQAYAFIQNWAFLLGVLSVGIGFILNLFKD